MIERIHSFWGIKPEHVFNDQFTGYEDHYDELDTFTKEVYDNDPTGTIDKVFDIYRNRGIVPIIYYTEQGLKTALKNFKTTNYNKVEQNVLGLGNNQGQTINRFLFTNMQTAEPKGRGSNSLKDDF